MGQILVRAYLVINPFHFIYKKYTTNVVKRQNRTLAVSKPGVSFERGQRTMELFQKSSTRYAARRPSSKLSAVTPYAGLEQHSDGDEPLDIVEHHCPVLPSSSVMDAYPNIQRILTDVRDKRAAHSSSYSSHDNNNHEETPRSQQEPSSSCSSLSSPRHASRSSRSLHSPRLHKAQAAEPEFLVTCRRKTTYEARVRLRWDSQPIYVGRYKSEESARAACTRMVENSRLATPGRKYRK